METKLILLGGGGHCKSCIDVIESAGNYEIAGVLDKQELVGTSTLAYQIIGTDNDIPMYHEKGYCFLITVGQIKNANIRKKLFALLTHLEADIVTIISPYARVSKYAQIGKGTIVMHNAIVNAEVRIGDNVIVNTCANVEHDVTIGDHCHISTNAVINGDSVIGNEVFIGSNATISSQVKVGDNIVVGAGAVVYKNIELQGIYAGNPAKIIS